MVPRPGGATFRGAGPIRAKGAAVRMARYPVQPQPLTHGPPAQRQMDAMLAPGGPGDPLDGRRRELLG